MSPRDMTRAMLMREVEHWRRLIAESPRAQIITDEMGNHFIGWSGEGGKLFIKNTRTPVALVPVPKEGA